MSITDLLDWHFVFLLCGFLAARIVFARFSERVVAQIVVIGVDAALSAWLHYRR